MLGKEIPRLRSSKNLLYLNGKDLRTLPLIERKVMLKKLLRRKRSRILYLDHLEGDRRLLFEQIVAMDLEGIVYKLKNSPYKVTLTALQDRQLGFSKLGAGMAWVDLQQFTIFSDRSFCVSLDLSNLGDKYA